MKWTLDTRKAWLVAAVGGLGLLVGCTGATDAVDDESATARAPAQVLMSIETPEEIDLDLPFTISGWALNEAAMQGTGIQRIQVLDGGCEGAVLGAPEHGRLRTDIAEMYGDQFRDSGWDFEVTRLHTGERILAVRVFAQGSNTYDACQALPVTIEE